jgi:uncharacterized protein
VALREEFRAGGYGLFTLSAGIGFWPAAILSAAFFGYSHHGNSGKDWIGVHMAFDRGETYFYGVADSGQVLRGHLLNSRSSGTAWLSGGTVGPEGSVLCTVTLIVVWLTCAAWLCEVKYPSRQIL